jgi:plasmid stabilization system protein ParE
MRKLRDKVLQSVDLLTQFSESGRGWRVPGCREVAVFGLPYAVIYRIHGEDVEILTLLHTSRETPDVH